MTALLLLLLALGIVTALIGIALQWWQSVRNPGKDPEPVIRQRPDDCCGQHEVCEKESLLAAVSKAVEYYDDEELDRFAGRRADSYDMRETDEFEEILTTLRSEDVAGWGRSLQLRGIELPEALRDEVIVLVGERRQ